MTRYIEGEPPMTDTPTPDPLRTLLDTLEAETTLPPKPTQYRRGWADAHARAAGLVRMHRFARPAPDTGLREALDVERLARAITNMDGSETWDVLPDDRETARIYAAEYARLQEEPR